MSALRLIEGGAADGGRDGDKPAPSAPLRERAPDGLLRELYERHAPLVFARCRYLLRDEEQAKDAMQDVFVKALRALPEFRAQASPHTWLVKIATHHCLNQLRAQRAGWREELRRLAEGRSVETEPPERRELLRALLGAAGEEEQEVAVLTFVDELTQAEIAQVTGRSLPTVRKRLRDFLAAARAALREALPGVRIAEDDLDGGAP
jgi:RNA polymerase sigma-70 factor, ECF subfamily